MTTVVEHVTSPQRPARRDDDPGLVTSLLVAACLLPALAGGIVVRDLDVTILSGLAFIALTAVAYVQRSTQPTRADESTRPILPLGYVVDAFALLVVPLAAAAALGAADHLDVLRPMPVVFMIGALAAGALVAGQPGSPLPRAVLIAVPLLCIAVWVAQGGGMKFTGFSTYKNVVGGLAFVGMMLSHAAFERRDATPTRPATMHRDATIAWPTWAWLFLTAITGSRSSLVAAVVFLAIARWSPTTAASAKAARATILASLAVPALYLALDRLPFFDTLEDLSLRLTGNPVYSGREEFWGKAFSGFATDPFIGRGHEFVIHYPDIDLYAHNLVLARAYFGGLLVLVPLAVFVVAAIRRAVETDAALSLAAFAAIAAHQTFEVNVGQGGIPVGIGLAFAWGYFALRTPTAPDDRLVD